MVARCRWLRTDLKCAVENVTQKERVACGSGQFTEIKGKQVATLWTAVTTKEEKHIAPLSGCSCLGPQCPHIWFSPGFPKPYHNHSLGCLRCRLLGPTPCTPCWGEGFQTEKFPF